MADFGRYAADSLRGTGGLGSILGGIFGNSDPYEEAAKQYEKYGQQAQQAQNPFHQAGVGAIPDYQKWLSGQQDPAGFINHLMGQYQESPYAHYLQGENTRYNQNFGSANGLSGSTALQGQAQQMSHDIASGDLNDWLAKVLGINTQYGQGVGNLITGGQNAANSLTQLFGSLGESMGNTSYGSQLRENQNRSGLIAGILHGLSFM